jgi:pimeloyl-ACP methyl ester carboxylesterase
MKRIVISIAALVLLFPAVLAGELSHYNRFPKAGHFAAWEQPQLFAKQVRAFSSLRVVFSTREEEIRHD